MATAVGRFEACSDCGQHGRIVFRDKTHTNEVGSKETAREFVEESFVNGWITAAEKQRMIEEVESTSLPEYEFDISEEVREFLEFFVRVAAVNDGDTPNPEEMHGFKEEAERQLELCAGEEGTITVRAPPRAC